MVQHREDGFLHLARVGGAADQNDLAGQVTGNDRLGPAAVTGRVRLEARQVNDGHLRNEAREFRRLGPQQQIANEQRMPSVFGVDANRKAMGLVRSAEKILCVEIKSLCMREKVGHQRVELCLGHLRIVVPPDRVSCLVIQNHELVFGRPAGVDTCFSNESTAGGEACFTTPERMLVKGRLALVPIDRVQIGESECFAAIGRIPDTCFLHFAAVLVRSFSLPETIETADPAMRAAKLVEGYLGSKTTKGAMSLFNRLKL